jgi:hypothetical protein
LDYLLKIAKRRRVLLQILPAKTRTFCEVSYPFTLLTIGAPGIASPLELAYIENYAHPLDQEQLQHHPELMSRTHPDPDHHRRAGLQERRRRPDPGVGPGRVRRVHCSDQGGRTRVTD